ncbi:MAG: nucleotidyltransferase domain-containing protein, partial [Pseudomonadota bacterium]
MKDLQLPPDDLICPAIEIFDTARTWSDIEDLIKRKHGDASELRSDFVSLLKKAQKQGRANIAEATAAAPFAARQTTRAYCWLTDCLVITTLRFVCQYLHPAPNPTEAERISVVAVGGYGRGEMAPFSDVDLLFLTPYKITPWSESVIESTLYVLWDLKLKVGHASRTVSECLRLAASDFTIRTGLLEKRYLFGDETLTEALTSRLRRELFDGTEREFIEAKLEERDARHDKQGARYMVEPNVKEGKGGLRDLQSLFWIAKYIYQVEHVADLMANGLFTEDEFSRFAQAENFLWAARNHLHLVTGRATEQLTFDLQVEVAERMRYADLAGRRAVEYFMQDYFRHATAVGDLTRIVLTKLEAAHVKPKPLIQRLFTRKPKLKPLYLEVHGRLGIADEKRFLASPLNLMRLFEEALRTGLLIHPDAMRLVNANLHLIDDAFRASPDARKLFLGLLLRQGNPERA